MAKLAIVLAAFAVLLLLADASIYRTTVVVDEENPQSCREQFQQQQNMKHCQEYMRQECRSRRRELFNQKEELRMCCQQLENVESRCRCDVLKMALEQQQQQIEREEMQEVMQVAQNIPSMCRMRPGRCDFRTTWLF